MIDEQVHDRPLSAGSRFVMLSGGLLAALALTAINSVLPNIDDALGGTPSASMMVKQLVGGVGLAMVFGAASSGFLVDRLGLRRVILLSSILYVMAGTAGLYIDSLPWLLASRLLLGLAAACIQVSTLAFINRRLAGKARATWMGYHMAVATGGTILIHPVAGMLGEISWRYPFALYGLGALLTVMMVFSRLDDEATERTTSSREDGLARVRRAFSAFPFHYLGLAFLVGSLTFLPNVYLPFILRNFGATPTIIAYVLTAESITGSVVALSYGNMRRYLSHRGVFLISFALVSAGTLIALSQATLPGVIAGMLVFGVGTGPLIANVMTSLGSKVPHELQGQAAGFVKAAHFLSGPVAIMLIEPVARVYGPASALAFVAAVSAVLAALTVARIASRRRSVPA